MQYKVGIAGGDLRQRYLAQLWIGNGQHPVYGAALCPADSPMEGLTECSLEELLDTVQVIGGPVPFSRDGMHVTGTSMQIEEFAGRLGSGQMLFAGVIPASIARYLRRRAVRFVDYMQLEQVAVQNAVATAEGAIAEGIRLWPENLAGSACLVLGYGRCGRSLAMRLKQFGGLVSVYARRKEVRAQIAADGLQPVDQEQLKEALQVHPLVWNTIPANVFTEELAGMLPKEHILLELASGQGCISRELMQQWGIHQVRCPGLPGRYAPKTSARILFAVMQELAEEAF